MHGARRRPPIWSLGITSVPTYPEPRLFGNGRNGVLIEFGATGNTIGGTISGVRNVISGNVQDGVEILGTGSAANLVAGDFLGTDATGLSPLGNGYDGVTILAGATGNTIGGMITGARNVISGNIQSGVYISDTATSNNLVAGDYIGTDATGANGLGNHINGVVLANGASSNIVGGTTSGPATSSRATGLTACRSTARER